MRCQTVVLPLLVVLFLAHSAAPGLAQPMTKALVADRIVKVENGVDEFRDYLERRGENADKTSSTAPAARGVAARPPSPRRRWRGEEGRAG